MIVYSAKPEEQYFEVIDKKGPQVIVLGETAEHWTSQTLTYLKTAEVPVFLFPWNKIPELRLQLNVIKYPVVQLWFNQKNECEVSGYQEETLRNLAHKFFVYKNKG